MRVGLATALVVLLQLSGHESLPINATSEEKVPWGIEESLSAAGYIVKFRGTWISENEFIYPRSTVDSVEYLKHNVKTNFTSVFVAGDKFKKYKNADFTLSNDKKKFLIAYEKNSVFRHSTTAKYDIYDIETDITYNIGNQEMLQHAKFSPANDRVAYVFKNNIYIFELNGHTHQVTTNGVAGVTYNGVPDWVYEEEVFSSASAMWWSPNGEKLAFAQFIDTNVEVFKYFIYGEPSSSDSQYPEEIDIRYPKPGTPNPNVSLHVADVTNLAYREVKTVELSAPRLVTDDHILQTVSWSSADQVVALWQNRRQNRAILVACAANTGDCKSVRDIYEPRGWVMTNSIDCASSDGKTCNMIDWIGNWMQIWKLDLESGENLNPKGFGNFTVLKIYGQRGDEWIYQATLDGNPTERHIYRNDKCLTCDLPDSEGAKCVDAVGSFSTDLGYVALSCNGPSPTVTRMYETDTMKVLSEWETNEKFRKNRLAKRLMPNVKFFKTKVEGDFDAIVKLYLPPDLDLAKPPANKQYPLVVYVYSGPNSAKIKSEFSVGWDSYLTTARNVIYAEIEGRGTANKGKDMLYVINNNLGTLEISDQIAVTKFLQKKYSFIDKKRTAIWGWSYGGYATAKVLSTDDDNVFQCGVSVAPVTAWLYYDTIYTERYMGLPVWHDNLRGYKVGSILSEDSRTISNFKKHDFLLMHGVADDNVHFQQSLQLSKMLQKNDVMFEEMMYPDENHSIHRLKTHLYHTMDQFLVNCLNMTATT